MLICQTIFENLKIFQACNHSLGIERTCHDHPHMLHANHQFSEKVNFDQPCQLNYTGLVMSIAVCSTIILTGIKRR